MANNLANVWAGLVAALALALGGCGGDDEGGLVDESDLEELDVSVCDPDAGGFTLDIDNQFFPLEVGRQSVLEGDDDGVLVRVVITVLDETEVVAGVTTRVVEESESEDGELVEVSRNFFVQASDGTVCYYGEQVDEIEDGEVTGHGGSWRVGEEDAQPGIIMPGRPVIGTTFPQERAPDVAEDQSAVLQLDMSVSVPAGRFENAIGLVDWNPLEGQTIADGEGKVYVQGIGLVVDGPAELVSRTTG